MSEGTSYRDAGVDIDRADAIVAQMESVIRTTWTDGCTDDFGGFAASFIPPCKEYRRPVLVACTDSVGTKIKLAARIGHFGGIGIDCVGMVVNDMVTSRARPLFFLDYIASARLEEEPILEITGGLADGCRQAGCALIGGETAEMPGVYQPGDYELVGFGVGITEGDPESTPRPPRPGDALVALASDGLHSNGFSLVRKLIDDVGWDLNETPGGLDVPLGQEVLRPTRIYVSVVLEMFSRGISLAAAHITGGGIPGNVPRVLPPGTRPGIDWSSWEPPSIFPLLADAGGISEIEMRRTFNMGVGMVLVVPPDRVDSALAAAKDADHHAWVIGGVIEGERGDG